MKTPGLWVRRFVIVARFLIVSDCGATARSSAVDTISLDQTQAFDEAAAQID